MTKKIRLIIPLIITFILVSFLISKIQLKELISTLTKVDLGFYVIGLILYTIDISFRSYRFKIYVKETSLFELFQVVGVSNLVSLLLPSRTGEISIIYLLKKKLKIPLSRGVPALLTLRIFDALSILILLFSSSLLLRNKISLTDQIFYPIILGGIFLFASALFLLLFYSSKIKLLFVKLGSKIKNRGHKMIDEILIKSEDLIKNFQIESKYVPPLFVLSIISWSLRSITFFFILSGLDMHLDILSTTFIVMITLTTTILPIQGVGNFGTMEGVWVGASLLLGIPLDVAILSGFSVHILSITYTLIVGFISLLTLKIEGKSFKKIPLSSRE
ncbi:MAG: lysylphosphatidylglycerol synthase transmembrane domain-containing protein [Candidatus Hodarchaeales archaeon]|jgi:uncharacterized protein (TIRG00374 family)